MRTLRVMVDVPLTALKWLFLGMVAALMLASVAGMGLVLLQAWGVNIGLH